MVLILPFTKQHISEVCILEKASFSEPWTEISFMKELENPQSYYIIAMKEGHIVGYAGMCSVMDEGHIMNIAVDKNFRAQGIGRQLVNALIERAYEINLMGLTLEVRKSNCAAIALYESLGFESVGERRDYYNYPTENAVIMWNFFH